MWSTVVYEEKKINPSSRSKHSLTLIGNQLYLLGGKNGNLPLKDFWKYDFVTSCWELLNPSGDVPPCLQEHTAVSYKDNIYVFGGELSFSAGNETPLWIYYTKTNKWRKICGQKGTNVPKGRRGHTTILHNGSALVYGGYCDLRGSSNELWVFHFETESWHLMMNDRNGPPARHKHSAILHDENMWVYGGMTDLQERSDMWRFDIVTKKWTIMRCKFSPGVLHSQAACKLHSSMLIFGGERNGLPVNELWRFHFGAETWERIETDAFCPQPMSDCCAVAVSELLLNDDGRNTTPGITNVTSTITITDDNRNKYNNGRNNIDSTAISQSHSANVKSKLSSNLIDNNSNSHNNTNNNNEYLFGDFLQSRITHDRRNVMVPPRRQATTPNSCNLNIFREIGKLSHMNLYQNKKCNYRVLRHSNSNESMNNSEDSIGTELTKCYSSNIVSVSSSGQTPVRVDKTIIDHNDNGYTRNNNNNNNIYGNGVVTPIEATKLVYLDGEEASVPDYDHQRNDDDNIRRRKTGSSSAESNHRNHNRRSYPTSSNSVRFANPLVTPDDQSLSGHTEYVSCENIHKLLATNISSSSNNNKTENNEENGTISFSNPIYFNKRSNNIITTTSNEASRVEDKISKGDYVKLFSPGDHLVGADINYECVEMKPMVIRPYSLSLHNTTTTACHNSEKRKKYRACSAGRYSETIRNPTFCIFLVGGKDRTQVTVFKRPITMWKLTLTNQIY